MKKRLTTENVCCIIVLSTGGVDNTIFLEGGLFMTLRELFQKEGYLSVELVYPGTLVCFYAGSAFFVPSQYLDLTATVLMSVRSWYLISVEV